MRLTEDQKAFVVAQYNAGAEARHISQETGLPLAKVQWAIAHARAKGRVIRWSYSAAGRKRRRSDVDRSREKAYITLAHVEGLR